MNRAQFDHVVRAAGAVLNVEEILVIGSQAVLASTSVPVKESVLSMEADVAVFGDDGSKSDLIDGALGELSMFHDTHGVYAQGVSESTAVLPDGWRERLVPYRNRNTGGTVAWCLEIHDLWISKAVAGRDKDRRFCASLLGLRLVEVEVLTARLRRMADQVDPVKLELPTALIRRHGRQAAASSEAPQKAGRPVPISNAQPTVEQPSRPEGEGAGDNDAA